MLEVSQGTGGIYRRDARRKRLCNGNRKIQEGSLPNDGESEAEPMTLFEGKMLKRLIREGIIPWQHTKRHETKALHRLANKGLAVFDEKQRQWTAKLEQNR
ncbi:hypothetical protein D4S03_10165 [bacterium]|nr:MAG: hypothetical protein D4S03_10165 [bacterium]